MTVFEIPGRGKIHVENIVFDYNGTLATDGAISREIREKIEQLKSLANIYILTADTHGTVRKNCGNLNVKIETFPKENAGSEKERIVEELGPEKTVCIGNGFNDIQMAEKCALFICLLGKEGCSGKLFAKADVVVSSIEDAFALFLKPQRLIATLRN